MKTAQVKIPTHETNLTDGVGQIVGKKNSFLVFFNLVLESKPQKTNAETIIAHSIKEKTKDIEDAAVPETLELDENEIDFLLEGIDGLRKDNRIVGTGWYFLIQPLRDAKDNLK